MQTRGTEKRRGVELRGRIARYGVLAGAIGLAGAEAEAVPIANFYSITLVPGTPVYLDVNNDANDDLKLWAAYSFSDAGPLHAFAIGPARSGVEIARSLSSLTAGTWSVFYSLMGKPLAAAFSSSSIVGGSGTAFTANTAVLYANLSTFGGFAVASGNFGAQPTPRFAAFRFSDGSTGLGIVELLHDPVNNVEVRASYFVPDATTLHAGRVVPEPSSLALLAAGAAGVAALRRRRTANAG